IIGAADSNVALNLRTALQDKYPQHGQRWNMSREIPEILRLVDADNLAKLDLSTAEGQGATTENKKPAADSEAKGLQLDVHQNQATTATTAKIEAVALAITNTITVTGEGHPHINGEDKGATLRAIDAD
ncbi:hypothetical protein FDECE_17718, partial [Fusarium decemcellulare]